MTNHSFFTALSVRDLELMLKSHQEEFDTLIGDSFSEDELVQCEKWLDALAAVYVQPILTDLTFDDFYADPKCEEEQRKFFARCKSSLSLENIPYFESNPFQISYLQMLLKRFEEVLIDQGGVNELVFKDDYLLKLGKFKNMDSLLGAAPVAPVVREKSSKPIDQIDFFVRDVYLEIQRLDGMGLLDSVEISGEKANKIFQVMKNEFLDSSEIYRKSGLNAKEYDDNMERLKFTLKKLPLVH